MNGPERKRTVDRLTVVGVLVFAMIVVAGTAVFAGGGWLGFATTHSSRTYSHARTLALAAGIEVLGVTLPTTAGQWGIAAMTASVTGSNGPYTCSWTFGDGGTSTSCSPSHSWTSGGTFTVGLTVTNGASHASASMVVGANAAYVTGSGGGFAPSLWSFAFSFPCKGVAVGGFPGQPCGVPIELPPGILDGVLITSAPPPTAGTPETAVDP